MKTKRRSSTIYISSVGLEIELNLKHAPAATNHTLIDTDRSFVQLLLLSIRGYRFFPETACLLRQLDSIGYVIGLV